MNYSRWFNIEDQDWPFGEEMKVFAEVFERNGSVQVGALKVMFRGIVDVTSALAPYEIQKLEKKIGDAFLNEKSEVSA